MKTRKKNEQLKLPTPKVKVYGSRRTFTQNEENFQHRQSCGFPLPHFGEKMKRTLSKIENSQHKINKTRLPKVANDET